MLNFNFESIGEVDENGLIWKPILRTGEWNYRPGANGKVKQKLRIVKGNSTNLNEEIGMADLLDSFNAGAVDHVTIPKSHANKVDENTGYIRDLKIEEDTSRPGQFVLKAGHEFTDAAIKEKVLEGSIANNSCGISTGYIDNETGKIYPAVLKHSCLTNEPFIHGMATFSDDDNGAEVYFDEADVVSKEATTINTENLIDVEKFSDSIFNRIKEFLTQKDENSYNESNQPAAENFSEANFNGGLNNMPQELSELNLSEEVISVLAEREASIKADAENAAKAELETKLSEAVEQKSELEEIITEFRAKEHASSVDAYIDELKELGFSESPGFLVAVRNILLADSGETTFNFSEDGQEKSLSVTDVVKTLVSSLPTKEGKVNLSEQAQLIPGDEKPELDTSKENKSVQERSEEAQGWLYNGPVAS